MKKIKAQDMFSDARGSITSLSVGTAWREVNRFKSIKGAIRGRHYHKETLELIFILKGSVEMDVENIKTSKKEKILLGANEGVIIDPYEKHTATILEDTEWLGLLTKEYDKDNPDIFE